MSNMTSHWRSSTLNILDTNGVTTFNLLLYTLQTRQPEQSHHRNILCNCTHDIMDLWSKKYPTEVEGWAMKAGIETYHTCVDATQFSQLICNSSILKSL